jgi:hypothetical protein
MSTSQDPDVAVVKNTEQPTMGVEQEGNNENNMQCYNLSRKLSMKGIIT